MGKRLSESMKRGIRGFIASNAYVDYGLGESINVLFEDDLVSYLHGKYGIVDYRVVYMFTRGEVLSDSRGKGSLQKVDDDID